LDLTHYLATNNAWYSNDHNEFEKYRLEFVGSDTIGDGFGGYIRAEKYGVDKDKESSSTMHPVSSASSSRPRTDVEATKDSGEDDDIFVGNEPPLSS
jgi:hypothetical protein